jgi:hypothetical protein
LEVRWQPYPAMEPALGVEGISHLDWVCRRPANGDLRCPCSPHKPRWPRPFGQAVGTDYAMVPPQQSAGACFLGCRAGDRIVRSRLHCRKQRRDPSCKNEYGNLIGMRSFHRHLKSLQKNQIRPVSERKGGVAARSASHGSKREVLGANCSEPGVSGGPYIAPTLTAIACRAFPSVSCLKMRMILSKRPFHERQAARLVLASVLG